MSRLVSSNFMRRLFGRPDTAEPSSPEPYQQLIDRLNAIEATLTSFAEQPSTPYTPDTSHVSERLDGLQQGLAAVEKQLQRSGREQLKVNALVEAQQEQARSTLESLEAAEARRDDELTAARQQIATAQMNARLDVVRQLLPVLDGIDEALRAGEGVLGQPLAAAQPTVFERMRARVSVPTPTELQLRSALRSWLHGLTFVRQRLLDILAAEQVRPIDALHQPFDPIIHIALHTVPASEDLPAGVIAAVLRAGYTVGERVLRHAEVTVAQANER